MPTPSGLTLTLNLPGPLAAFVAEQAARTGATPEAYLLALVEQSREDSARTLDPRERIEALLIEGLESGPATPMTDGDWADIRTEVHRRLARGSGADRRP